MEKSLISQEQNPVVPQPSPKWRLFLYGVLMYCLLLPWFGLFLLQPHVGNGLGRDFFFLTSLVAYPFLWSLPALACAAIGFRNPLKKAWRITFCSLAAFCAFFAGTYLVGDLIMLMKFGFHFNGLVFNLIFTPGGLESMGLDWLTIFCLTGLCLLYLGFQVVLVFFCLNSITAGRIAAHLSKRRWLAWAAPVFLLVSLFASIFTTAVGDFRASPAIMANIEVFPGIITLRSRKFFKALGFKPRPRQEMQMLSRKNVEAENVKYPAKPIQRNPERKKYNIVWLVCESLRADLLTEEAMPNTWNFAKTGHRFLNHYSGGRGTRPGMFSMFYALYGNNWQSFLGQRRGPLIIDWMRQDNAQFLCQTSAKFSYPEFDQTIFVTLSTEELREHPKGFPPDRDVTLTDQMLDFIQKRDPSRPFFVFGFFESTHAPYTFPPDKAIRKDYLPKINYATVSPKDAPLLFNRDINAAHHIDSQIGRIIETVMADPQLAQSTIFVITGDHGEEFFENGRLGHNSAFVQQQIHPPLVLWFPGCQPTVHEQMTHHTDIVPTLATLLGVENPSEDFSVGQNLLDPGYGREYFIVCGWEEAAFVNSQYKFILPIGAKGAIFRRDVTTIDDKPIDEAREDEFFQRYAPQLQQALRDMTKFVGK
ncbi:MAG: sulfatase-like hydrolase/transferase [Victivallales bacterium]|nr:sulfatase-like hydrolase/transferase [Victivallales bacterium]